MEVDIGIETQKFRRGLALVNASVSISSARLHLVDAGLYELAAELGEFHQKIDADKRKKWHAKEEPTQ